MTRLCKHCREPLAAGRGHRAVYCGDGCKYKAHYAKRREASLAATRDWLRRNPTYHRDHYTKNRSRFADNHQRLKYGISLEEKQAMFLAQGERCAICGGSEPGTRGWCTDHCHKTGKVRGVLCQGCNKGIGYFQDNLNVLQSAVKYLDRL